MSNAPVSGGAAARPGPAPRCAAGARLLRERWPQPVVRRLWAAFGPRPVGTGRAVLCPAGGSAGGGSVCLLGGCQAALEQHLVLPFYENRSSPCFFFPNLFLPGSYVTLGL